MTDNRSAHARLRHMVENNEKAPSSTIQPLFARLEPASLDFMIGQWRGGNFRDATTVPNFYGKRFTTAENCEPMLRTDGTGNIYAWADWGEARLREVAYAGKVQAAVIYDDRPLMDYFRVVHDDLVIGMGDWKGREHKNYFWLTRDKDFCTPSGDGDDA